MSGARGASSPLALVELSGAPREQGRIHGEAARAAVAHNLAVYSRRFAVEGGLSRAEALDRGGRYLAVIDAQAPAYGEAAERLAEGSGCGFPELAALNARYERLCSEFSRSVMELAGRLSYQAPGHRLWVFRDDLRARVRGSGDTGRVASGRGGGYAGGEACVRCRRRR